MSDSPCRACGADQWSDAGEIFHPHPATIACVPLAIDGVDYRLVRCTACGLLVKFPDLPQDQVAACYAASTDVVWPQPDRLWLADLVKLVEQHTTGRRILDVGCFTGGMLQAFTGGWKRAGVEPSAAAAATARSQGIEIIGATLEEPDPHRRTFDAILLLNVIEHVQNPRVLLAQITERLAPDGIVVVMTGDADAWPWRLSGSQYWYCSLVEHISFLNRSSLGTLAHAAGLSIADYRRICAGMMPLRQRVVEAGKFLTWLMLRAVRGFGLPVLHRFARRHRSPMCQAFPDHLMAVLRRTAP